MFDSTTQFSCCRLRLWWACFAASIFLIFPVLFMCYGQAEPRTEEALKRVDLVVLSDGRIRTARALESCVVEAKESSTWAELRGLVVLLHGVSSEATYSSAFRD